jgi:vacuolar-type H+-ATPase subunit H
MDFQCPRLVFKMMLKVLGGAFLDTIIKKILEIEQKAQQIVDDANQEQQKIEESLKLEILEMKEKIQQRTERKIQQIREKELQEARQKVKEIEIQSKLQVEAMDKYAKQKRDEWEKMLMSRIIGW